jgi:hypothetical protein
VTQDSIGQLHAQPRIVGSEVGALVTQSHRSLVAPLGEYRADLIHYDTVPAGGMVTLNYRADARYCGGEGKMSKDYFTSIVPFDYKGHELSATLVTAGPALSNAKVPAVQRPPRWHGYMDGKPLHQWDAKDGEGEEDVRVRLRTEAAAAIRSGWR